MLGEFKVGPRDSSKLLRKAARLQIVTEEFVSPGEF
jgi:hypothetical protein